MTTEEREQKNADWRSKHLSKNSVKADVIKSVFGEETTEQTINRIADNVTDWKPFPNEPKTVL